MTWYPFPNVPVVAAAKLKLYAIIGAVFLAVVIAVGVSAWFMGKQDQKDAQASKDVVELKDALKKATDDLRLQQTTLAAALKETAAAQQRQAAIATRTELQIQEQERISYELKNNLERALLARPDLAAVHVGTDVLCNWNKANSDTNTGRTTGAAGTAAVPGCKPAGALPGTTTGNRRLTPEPAAKPAGKRKDGQGLQNKSQRPE